jgi:hypothetical protein
MARRCASRIALFLSAVALAGGLGCGSPTTPSVPDTLNISGNWDIVSSTGTTNPAASIIAFYGALQSSNGAVSGTLHALGSNLTAPCVSLSQDLPVTGTIDSANNLALNVAIGGGTAALQVPLTQDLQSAANGTYSIAGGTCGMASAPMFAIQIPPVTGTYAGTLTLFQSSPAVTAAVTAQLTQSSTPTADGYFPLSGTISIAGGCPSTVSVSNEVLMGGSIEGGSASLVGLVLPPTPPATAFSISATVGAASPSCSPTVSIWSGTLTPQ